MDAGLPIRPLATATQAGVARPESVPVRQATPTELAPGQSVAASEPGQRLAQDRASGTGFANAAVDREVIVDSEAREVIFRMIDTRTGVVKTQVPAEAMLRLRRYAEDIAAGLSLAESKAALDRVA